MQRLIEKCRESGYHALIACITKGNETSYALHAKLGFKQVAGYEQVGRKFNRWLGVVDYKKTQLLNRINRGCIWSNQGLWMRKTEPLNK